MLGMREGPTVADNRYLPPVIDDIKVISMGFLVPAEQAVVWRGPMLHKAVRDFLHSVEWGTLDYLFVDLPPGTGDVVLSLSQQTPVAGGVIVCTPQDVALLDAKKALNMLETVKIPCLGIVENMSGFDCPHCGQRSDIFGQGGAEKWAREREIPFLGAVPINLQLRINSDDGHLRDNFADENPVRDALFAVADKLAAVINSRAPRAAPTIELV
jgi:ATP-binding protein involved in chromosome partitioning